jgi:flagellum-specific peptidoglycan hydrolase FlgJ
VEKQAFISKFGSAALTATEFTPFLPSVIIAQAALESNWGDSALTVKGFNFFGIKKGSTWKGKTISFSTGEVIQGSDVSEDADFRYYENAEQSFADRILLMDLPGYAAVKDKTTAEDQAQALQAAGYATDPNYSSKIISIINSNNLKEFDLKKKPMKNLNIIICSLIILAAAIALYKTLKY